MENKIMSYLDGDVERFAAGLLRVQLDLNLGKLCLKKANYLVGLLLVRASGLAVLNLHGHAGSTALWLLLLGNHSSLGLLGGLGGFRSC